MSAEQQVAVQEGSDQPDVAEQQGTEADFLAGFNAVRTKDGAAPAQETNGAPAEEAGAQASTDHAQSADQARPDATIAQQPRPQPQVSDDYAALRAEIAKIQQVSKGLETLAGTVGGLKRQLEQIVKSQPAGSPASEGAKKVLAELKLTRLQEAYPDVAEVLAQDLAEIIPATGGESAAVNPEQLEELVQQRIRDRTAELEARFERKLLERDHPNWELELAEKDERGQPKVDATGKYVPAADFVQWLYQKGPQFAQEFTTSIDSSFLSKGLTEFKQWRAKTQNSRQFKQARLAAAVEPTQGLPSQVNQSLSDAEEFLAGFRSVRGSG